MENVLVQNPFYREMTDERIAGKVVDGIKRRLSVTVGAKHEDVYAFWRDFRNLPLFMKEISDVVTVTPTRSHWMVDLKKGPRLEWDAEIIADRPGEMISWHTIGESMVRQTGSVWFKKAPADLGTVISLQISYDIPGGRMAEWGTKLLGEDPETLIMTHLRRFKAYIETGEIPTTDGQPSGRDEEATYEGTH